MTHPWHTNGGYQKTFRWVGDDHTSPDAHAYVCVRINLALFERRGSKIVGD